MGKKMGATAMDAVPREIASGISDMPDVRASGETSIPRRVLAASVLALLIVGGAALYAVHAVQTLADSTATLMNTGIPLQDRLLRLRDTQRQAEFFLQVGDILNNPDYHHAFDSIVARERSEITAMRGASPPDSDLAAALAALDQSVAAYARAGASGGVAGPLQTQVETRFQRADQAVDNLVAAQGRKAAEARRQALWTLYGLILVTALLGILIPWRVAVALAQPLKGFRKALEEIGEGRLAKVAAAGPAELRELARGIERMQERLHEEERLRHEFLSQVSHELKTPLASARSGTELLLTGRLGPLVPRQQEVLEIVHRQVLELYAAIQEMLDMHALQSRSLDFSPQTVAVGEILAEICRRMEPLTQKKHQHLSYQAPEGLTVRADPQRLRQILTNLVSNAHKYTPGGADIHLLAEQTEGGVEFRVEDSGPGIPEALLGRVFDRFFQVPGGAGLPRGTGLGLAICKELAEAQGGRISLENRAEGGLRARLWMAAPSPEMTEATAREA